MLRIALVAIVAVGVGVTVGWRYVLPPLLGLAIWQWATATLRSMAGGAPGIADREARPRPVDAGERVLYWCGECGTEFLLLVRGTGAAPRHCGTAMHERTEILN